MEDRNLNYAGENAQVGVQGNNVNGPFTVNFGRSHSQVAVDPALQEILGQLEQLRLAIAAAQQRTELARAASVTALQELEAVDQGCGGPRGQDARAREPGPNPEAPRRVLSTCWPSWLRSWRQFGVSSD